MFLIDSYESPIGTLWYACDEDGLHLTRVWLPGSEPPAEDRTEAGCFPVIKQTRDWLARYFRGQDPGPCPPLAPQGTPYQMAIWELIREIPYGQTASYKDLAVRYAEENGLDRPAPHPVGQAVGRNPIPLIVPCHRVIGADGNLTGYGGGIDLKIRLLQLEGVDTGRLKMPRGNRFAKEKGPQ